MSHGGVYHPRAKGGAMSDALADAREALGAPGRRRIRTKVGQQLIAAFLVAAANMRKIRSFLERAEIDADGDYYVVRTERKGDHARTGLIPGTAPPEEQPAAA